MIVASKRHQPRNRRSTRRVKSRPRPIRVVNIGVLEATGTLIVDDRRCFEEMQSWTDVDRARQVELMLTAIAPAADKVAEFETVIQDLFPACSRSLEFGNSASSAVNRGGCRWVAGESGTEAPAQRVCANSLAVRETAAVLMMELPRKDDGARTIPL